MKSDLEVFLAVIFTLCVALALSGCVEVQIPITDPAVKESKISRFSSGDALLKAFEDARESGSGPYYRGFGIMKAGGVERVMEEAAVAAPQAADTTASGKDFSETNVQVQGVDEADIIKTDGDYIYTIAQGNIVIAKAYPAEDAEILSTTKLSNFYPQELFIDNDKLLVFGSSSYTFESSQEQGEPAEGQAEPAQGDIVSEKMVASIRAPDYYPNYRSFMTVKMYDISDRENPELIRNVDFEGSYLTSRKIGDYAYFVVNSYPSYWDKRPLCEDIVPMYRDSSSDKEPKLEDMKPIAKCVEIGYIEPIQAENFITVASISMADDNADINKEVIVGSGQNVYASLENLYIAQTAWPRYNAIGDLAEDFVEKTVITKFGLDNGEIDFLAKGEVKGTILNQFSMDEYDTNFRIATTISGYVDNKDTSTNNMYVLDKDMKVVGELEGVAPGESIYSVRFMGKRGYMVTFRHVDPLFVIDLSDPQNPSVLGKLKIPGYSDYLHPYDETHLIGIGKEVDASIDADKIHTEGAVYYTAIQGVKLAIFDVSDVENPVEMYKEVIGDRGTESPAATDHKAFLFDKEKGILVIPMTVAELKPGQPKNMEGEYTFQGAYVYNINLEDGFKLRGRVTQYDDNETFAKAGYYFRGDYSIKRNLYIDNVLYTLSDSRLQLNDLDSMERLKALDFEKSEDYSNDYPGIMY
jgi:inhibitor of cysteine peptidase